MRDKVCIIGSGNWGSAIATIIGPNVLQLSSLYEPMVHMWVYEEMVSLPSSLLLRSSSKSSSMSQSKKKHKLTEVINTYHENVKYLPNIPLPKNIVATSSIEQACHNATLLIFVLPHQFLNKLLPQICDSKLHPTNCRAISLIKGIDFDRDLHRPKLISNIIQDAIRTKIPSFHCGVLMGANIANEVAQQRHVCESTLACNFNNTVLNEQTRLLFHNEHCFRVQQTTDITLTEICGAIKNCVALGAGYIDGLGYGSNTKAALLRVGLHEIYQFAMYFFSSKNNAVDDNNIRYATMMESCGVADLITTCYSGRNRLCAETFAKERMTMMTNVTTEVTTTFDTTCQKHWEDIELRILNGQKIQGVSTIYEVYHILQAQQNAMNNKNDDDHTALRYFPLLCTIYKITYGIQPVSTIVNGIRIVPVDDTNMKRQTVSGRYYHQRSFL